MRFTQSEKYEIIRMVDGSEVSANKTIKELGISKSTFYNWYKRYLKDGFDGLSTHKRDQNRIWNKIPVQEKNRVVEVALDKPELSSFSQMQYARSVDNINTYFKDILAEVVEKWPEILKSAELERLDFILQFETMEEFVDAIVEKKTEELFYGSINKIEEFFEKKLNVKLFKSKVEKDSFNLIIKNRNLIVHNRGRVNSQFLRDFPFLNFEKGQFLRYTFQDLAGLSVTLSGIAGHLDYEIAKKYNLTRIKIGN